MITDQDRDDEWADRRCSRCLDHLDRRGSLCRACKADDEAGMRAEPGGYLRMHEEECRWHQT